MRVLVAGSTGMVGGEAACLLAARGDEVRGLVRRTSDESNVAALRASGVTVVEGDLRDGQSLTAVCRGVDAVVKTVSAMPFSRKEGNTIGDVDRDGTIRLIDAANRQTSSGSSTPRSLTNRSRRIGSAKQRWRRSGTWREAGWSTRASPRSTSKPRRPTQIRAPSAQAPETRQHTARSGRFLLRSSCFLWKNLQGGVY